MCNFYQFTAHNLKPRETLNSILLSGFAICLLLQELAEPHSNPHPTPQKRTSHSQQSAMSAHVVLRQQTFDLISLHRLTSAYVGLCQSM